MRKAVCMDCERFLDLHFLHNILGRTICNDCLSHQTRSVIDRVDRLIEERINKRLARVRSKRQKPFADTGTLKKSWRS